MSRTAAREKLDAIGIDAVCDAIGDGTPLRAIAQDAGVSIGSLLTWIESDADRSARVRDSRAAMAKYWDERSEQVLETAGDEFELKKAKELSHHYRWRATKIAPREYGNLQQVEHSGKIGLEDLVASASREAGDA